MPWTLCLLLSHFNQYHNTFNNFFAKWQLRCGIKMDNSSHRGKKYHGMISSSLHITKFHNSPRNQTTMSSLVDKMRVTIFREKPMRGCFIRKQRVMLGKATQLKHHTDKTVQPLAWRSTKHQLQPAHTLPSTSTSEKL